MAYKPKHFVIQELVSPVVYKKQGDKAWSNLEENTLVMLDLVWDLFKKTMIVNTWDMSDNAKKLYGNFSYRGFREKGCGVGSVNGAHYKGKGIDFNIWEGNRRYDDERVRKVILDNKEKIPMLRGMEVTEGWVHIDTMVRAGQKVGSICLFSPTAFIEWA